MSDEQPVYHSDKLTYGSYLKVPELLDLQQERSEPPHHDELLFIISHQVYELWFKQLLHEIRNINTLLDADNALRAGQRFERVHKVQDLLIKQVPLLETMFAADFAAFRDNLRPASGFQSVQFRKVEFLCGAKNPNMLKLVGDDDSARQEMASVLDAPTPYDHFLRHLAREDSDIFRIPRHVLSRDTTKPHETDEQVVASLEILYRESEKYWAQYRLAEHLVEFDEKLAIWRFHHVKMVERMIGGLGGTGGSSGAKYLRKTLERTLYPDLWAIRDHLGGIYGQARTDP